MKPVLDPAFWRDRLLSNGDKPIHHVVYHINETAWADIERNHRQLLTFHVEPLTSVLDVGCGYGRLLELMPPTWLGRYTGIDLSPDLIQLAQQRWKERVDRFWFCCGRAEQMLESTPDNQFDLGVTISVKRMLIDNGHAHLWEKIEREMIRTCKLVLILEYDAKGGGEVIG